MPPSVRRTQRARRDTRKEATTSSDAVADSSPSRPAKRRKKAQDEGPAPMPDDDQLVTQITQQLKSSAVQASKDHSNAIHEANGDGVKAYAKVAAQDWTYYITRLLVNIGRAQEGGQSEEDDEDQVHIDLGPGKMVSREHAAISFDSKHEQWILNIKGRNGAKVDGQPLKAGSPHTLQSGEVVEIGGVEMMFVLPTEISPLHVDPTFLQRCGISTDTPQARKVRRQATIAPTPPQLERPGTPPSTQDHSPSRVGKSPGMMSTPAVMMGANGIDLSLDENQHIKPQYSYAQMITQAILSEDDGKLNLNGIYQFIMNSYAYYRHQQTAGWQNSIRHNLSLNKAFEKVPRLTDEAGKGLKWQIVPEAKEDMVRNAYRVGRGGHRGSSAPSSPNQLNYITHGPRDMAARGPGSARKRRASPLASPSPRPAFNAGQSTPERPAARALGRAAGLAVDGSPLPRTQKSTPATSSYSSFNPQSPTLTSSYLQDDNASFVTPAPPRVHPKLAPPSTAQRPSQHMPTSSPAPFWKYAEFGSTPLKPITSYDLSPTKNSAAERPTLPPPPVVQSSSPPPQAQKSLPSSPLKPQKGTPQPEPEPEADDEQGFDLTKGFQSIGAYHAPVGRGVPVPNALQGRT